MVSLKLTGTLCSTFQREGDFEGFVAAMWYAFSSIMVNVMSHHLPRGEINTINLVNF